MRTSRHKRFYSGRKDKKTIPPLDIKSGMIIEFAYRDKDRKPSRPLVFVVDTDEYGTRDKKVFHGLNLNHVPYTEVEKFFIAMGKKVGWELDKQSKFPKMNLYEEEDTGIRPVVFYKQIIKPLILKRFDCWRSYKYMRVKSVKQIKWNFESKSLKEVYNELETQQEKRSTTKKPKQAKKPKQPKKIKTETKKPEQPVKPKQSSKPKSTTSTSEQGFIDKFFDKVIEDFKKKFSD